MPNDTLDTPAPDRRRTRKPKQAEDADYPGSPAKEPRFPTFDVGKDGVLSVLLRGDLVTDYQTVREALRRKCEGPFPSFYSDVGGSSASIVELNTDPATGAPCISAPWKRERIVSRLNGCYRWMKLVKVKVDKEPGAIVAKEAPKEVWERKKVPECPVALVTGMWGDIPAIGLPILRGVKSGPFIDKNGRIVADKGYDRETGFYVAGDVAPVLDGWTPEKVRETLYEWLVDFPFDNDHNASRAHAIGCFLLPFVRLMIDGPTMIHAITAPGSRTGKSKLAATLMYPALGREIAAAALPATEEEAQKTVFADLLAGPDVLFYDNSKAPVGGAFLEAAITSQYPKARVLGLSEMRAVPNFATWIMTGSNIESSPDIANRSVRIHIDRGLADPTSFTGYKHPDIEGYTLSIRHKLVGAALWAAREWFRSGAKPPKDSPSDFRDYCRVIGGILEYLGIPGFMANRAENKASMTPAEIEWRGFMAMFLHCFPDGSDFRAGGWALGAPAGGFTESVFVKAKHLCEIAKRADILDIHRTEKGSGAAANFGRALSAHRGRIFDLDYETIQAAKLQLIRADGESIPHCAAYAKPGGYRLTMENRSGVSLYQLKLVSPVKP